MKHSLAILFFSLLSAFSANAQVAPIEAISTFNGKIIDGKRQGWGKLESPTSAYVTEYEGEWKDNLPVGKFMVKFTNGNMYYGDLTPDFNLTGDAVFEAPTGNAFIGSFVKNRLQGWGLFYIANPANPQYIFSKFEDGLPTGPSKIYFPGKGYYEASMNKSFTISGPVKVTNNGKTSYGIIENNKWTKNLTGAEYNTGNLWNDSQVPAKLAFQLKFFNRMGDANFKSFLNPFFYRKASLDPPAQWLPFRFNKSNGFVDRKGNVMLRLMLPAGNQVIMQPFGKEEITMVREYRKDFITEGEKIYYIDQEGTSLVDENIEPGFMIKYPFSQVKLTKYGDKRQLDYNKKYALYNFSTKRILTTTAIDSNMSGTYTVIDANAILKATTKEAYLIDGTGKLISPRFAMLTYLPANNAFIASEPGSRKAGIKDRSFTKWLIQPIFEEIKLAADQKTLIAKQGGKYCIINNAGQPVSSFYNSLYIPSDFMMKDLDKRTGLYFIAEKGKDHVLLNSLGKEVLSIGARTMSSQVAGGSFLFSENIGGQYQTGLMTLTGKVVLPPAKTSQSRIADSKAGLFTMEMPRAEGDYNYVYKVFKADGELWNNETYKLGIDFINGFAVSNTATAGSIINTTGAVVYKITGYPDSRGLSNGLYYAGFGNGDSSGKFTQYYIQLPSGLEYKPKYW